MREWFTTLFKALEDEQLQLFIKSDTDIFSYTINPLLKRNNNNFKYFKFKVLYFIYFTIIFF